MSQHQKRKIMEGLTCPQARRKVLEIFKDSALPEVAKVNKKIWVWMECWSKLRSRTETFDIIAQAFAEKISRLHAEKRALENTVHNQRIELAKMLKELTAEKDYLSKLRASPDFKTILAAHYEPVPEPPAGEPEPESPEEAGYCFIPNRPVSEEQPAPIQAQSKTDYKRLKALGANVIPPAPHRATIAIRPCSVLPRADKRFHIEVDGVELMVNSKTFCEREAEAKAKMESLSKNLAGEKG